MGREYCEGVEQSVMSRARAAFCCLLGRWKSYRWRLTLHVSGTERRINAGVRTVVGSEVDVPRVLRSDRSD